MGSDSNYNQFPHSTFIQNYHFLLHCLPSSIPKLSFSRYLTILCAIFPVRIPHRFYVCFRFAQAIKSVSGLRQSPGPLRYALLLSGIYSQDSKSAGCQPPHQSDLPMLPSMQRLAPDLKYIQRPNSVLAGHNSHTALLPSSIAFYRQSFPYSRRT